MRIADRAFSLDFARFSKYSSSNSYSLAFRDESSFHSRTVWISALFAFLRINHQEKHRTNLWHSKPFGIRFLFAAQENEVQPCNFRFENHYFTSLSGRITSSETYSIGISTRNNQLLLHKATRIRYHSNTTSIKYHRGRQTIAVATIQFYTIPSWSSHYCSHYNFNSIQYHCGRYSFVAKRLATRNF